MADATKSPMKNEFWKTKSLFDMTRTEWESVCDGCAKCCLQQLQDEQTEQLVFTDVVCDLLDEGSCKCTDYLNRSTRVPSCMTMTKENVEECAEFAPPSCAYRLLLVGEDLPEWHHLNTGHKQSIHTRGKSVRGRVRQQNSVDMDKIEDFVVDWV